MITKVNDMDLRVLSLFTRGFRREFYIREVQHLLAVSSRTALVTLDKLERIGVLESKVRGKIKVFTLRKTEISFHYLLLAEHYKRIVFFRSNPLIFEIAGKVRAFHDGITVIFGSYAKASQKKDSDLDIFIVGAHDKESIIAIGMKYGIEINIKSYPLNIMETDPEDLLLREIADNHIIINGTERYVELTWTR